MNRTGYILPSRMKLHSHIDHIYRIFPPSAKYLVCPHFQNPQILHKDCQNGMHIGINGICDVRAGVHGSLTCGRLIGLMKSLGHLASLIMELSLRPEGCRFFQGNHIVYSDKLHHSVFHLLCPVFKF